MHVPSKPGHIGHSLPSDKWTDGLTAVANGGLFEELNRRRWIWVADAGSDEEAIELCLREAIGAHLFDGVLRGDHHEGRADRVRHSVDGDLALLHDLEQRRLCFR